MNHGTGAHRRRPHPRRTADGSIVPTDPAIVLMEDALAEAPFGGLPDASDLMVKRQLGGIVAGTGICVAGVGDCPAVVASPAASPKAAAASPAAAQPAYTTPAAVVANTPAAASPAAVTPAASPAAAAVTPAAAVQQAQPVTETPAVQQAAAVTPDAAPAAVVTPAASSGNVAVVPVAQNAADLAIASISSAAIVAKSSALVKAASILVHGGVITTTDASGGQITVSGTAAAASLSAFISALPILPVESGTYTLPALASSTGSPRLAASPTTGVTAPGGSTVAQAATSSPTMAHNSMGLYGGAIGGAVGAILFGALVFFCIRRRMRSNKAATMARNDAQFFTPRPSSPTFIGFPVSFTSPAGSPYASTSEASFEWQQTSSSNASQYSGDAPEASPFADPIASQSATDGLARLSDSFSRDERPASLHSQSSQQSFERKILAQSDYFTMQANAVRASRPRRVITMDEGEQEQEQAWEDIKSAIVHNAVSRSRPRTMGGSTPSLVLTPRVTRE